MAETEGKRDDCRSTEGGTGGGPVGGDCGAPTGRLISAGLTEFGWVVTDEVPKGPAGGGDPGRLYRGADVSRELVC